MILQVIQIVQNISDTPFEKGPAGMGMSILKISTLEGGIFPPKPGRLASARSKTLPWSAVHG